MDLSTAQSGWLVAAASLAGHVYTYLSPLKGALTMPNLETGLAELHACLKFAVKVLPGNTLDEKKAAVDGWLDPLLKGFLAQQGVSEQLTTAIVSLFNVATGALVTAEFAPAA